MNRLRTFARSMTRRKLTASAKKLCAAAQGWRCDECAQLLEASFQVDHRLALADGGTDTPDNLRALCQNCHGRKTYIENNERTERMRSVNSFNALFERFDGGAYPLAAAKRLSYNAFGRPFDERHIDTPVAPHMVFPPHWAKLFLDVGLPPEHEGPVLQCVRRKPGLLVFPPGRARAVPPTVSKRSVA